MKRIELRLLKFLAPRPKILLYRCGRCETHYYVGDHKNLGDCNCGSTEFDVVEVTVTIDEKEMLQLANDLNAGNPTRISPGDKGAIILSGGEELL